MTVPVTKTILVMASSIKKFPDRCVAGFEMIPKDGNFAVGKWIRPVDPSQPEGAIPFLRTVVGGQTVCPLHCVEMIFTGPANDPDHPEDWILAPETNWKIVGKSLENMIARSWTACPARPEISGEWNRPHLVRFGKEPRPRLYD